MILSNEDLNEVTGGGFFKNFHKLFFSCHRGTSNEEPNNYGEVIYFYRGRGKIFIDSFPNPQYHKTLIKKLSKEKFQPNKI